MRDGPTRSTLRDGAAKGSEGGRSGAEFAAYGSEKREGAGADEKQSAWLRDGICRGHSV